MKNRVLIFEAIAIAIIIACGLIIWVNYTLRAEAKAEKYREYLPFSLPEINEDEVWSDNFDTVYVASNGGLTFTKK